MDEMIKVLNEKGEDTGKVVEKLKAHKEGLIHGVSGLAIINSEGKVMLQKRALTKRDAPGKWDVSAAGHIDLDETAEEALIRETYEEIGLTITKDDIELIDEFLFKIVMKDKAVSHYTYLYIMRKDIDISTLVLDEREVAEIKYVDKKEYIRLLENGEMSGQMPQCGKILEYIK